jgi:hypothetical protein
MRRLAAGIATLVIAPAVMWYLVRLVHERREAERTAQALEPIGLARFLLATP